MPSLRPLGPSLVLGLLTLGLLALTTITGPQARAADHGDTPLLASIPRHDARLTDLHAFVRGGDLVLALSTNPAIPPGVIAYSFPSDLTLRIFVDNDSEVRFDDPGDLATYGGTVARPKKIREDVVFEIRFDDAGAPRLRLIGLPQPAADRIRLFAGLRDDPFVRGPRIGRNVASVVLEMPLDLVLAGEPTLLLWATSDVPDVEGRQAELAGRSLRSMFPENDPMNTLHPCFQATVLGAVPDVMIYDTSLPAAYPNGRELTDDVADLVGDPRILDTDAPFPGENDVPFLDAFPYLAPPQ
jgi:hypothetical protein